MTSDEMEEGQSSFYDGDNNNDGHTFWGVKVGGIYLLFFFRKMTQ